MKHKKILLLGRPSRLASLWSLAVCFLLSCSVSISPPDRPSGELRNGKSGVCASSGEIAGASGCGADQTEQRPLLPPMDAQPSSQEQLLDKVQALSDESAMKFFIDNCQSCHSSKTGSAANFWALSPEQFSKQTLATDSLAPQVFAAILLKAKDIGGAKPAPMPLGLLKPEVKEQLLPVLKWMVNEMPSVVQEAQILLNGTDAAKNLGNGTNIVLEFKCSQPASSREYIRRLVNDAFGREPTAIEFGLASGKLDAPVLAADRMKLSARLLADVNWKKEFEEKTLLKFSTKLAGTADIQPQEGMISEEQAQDLREEFYQLVKASYETSSFKDLILGSQVMVSPRTAALYGCAAPTSGWAACKMSLPRGSFFTTFGYLRSKPSSFLRPNNNYGRAALMNFVVRGDVLKPGFDEDDGKTSQIRPLPSCLKSKDFRGQKGTGVAWRGSASVPLTANLCQSCHIDRQMAAGSILFRPFSITGHLYGTSARVDESDPDFASATAADMISQPNMKGEMFPVTASFLRSLLESDGTEQACIDAANAAGQELPLKSVKDLAAYMIGDGRSLTNGLARHLPRAMSNLPSTTEEVIFKVNKASADNQGLLGPMITAYFSSETYACKK